MSQFIPILQAQKAMCLAMAAQIDALLAMLVPVVAEKPVEEKPEGCQHPNRVATPRMGSPNAYRCLGGCGQEFEA